MNSERSSPGHATGRRDFLTRTLQNSAALAVSGSMLFAKGALGEGGLDSYCGTSNWGKRLVGNGVVGAIVGGLLFASGWGAAGIAVIVVASTAFSKGMKECTLYQLDEFERKLMDFKP